MENWYFSPSSNAKGRGPILVSQSWLMLASSVNKLIQWMVAFWENGLYVRMLASREFEVIIMYRNDYFLPKHGIHCNTNWKTGCRHLLLCKCNIIMLVSWYRTYHIFEGGIHCRDHQFLRFLIENQYNSSILVVMPQPGGMLSA